MPPKCNGRGRDRGNVDRHTTKLNIRTFFNRNEPRLKNKVAFVMCISVLVSCKVRSTFEMYLGDAIQIYSKQSLCYISCETKAITQSHSKTQILKISNYTSKPSRIQRTSQLPLVKITTLNPKP